VLGNAPHCLRASAVLGNAPHCLRATLGPKPPNSTGRGFPGHDTDAAPLLERAGLPDPTAIRHAHGRGHFPHRDDVLRALGPEPWNAAFVQPCRRPTDGRYGENPNRLQHYYQYQVILKPSPPDLQELYLGSLDRRSASIR
jgi:hypothetical protein